MLAKDFIFQNLENGCDVEQQLELMRTVFGENSRIDLQVKKWIDYHPSMTLEDFFVIKHHDKIVATLCLIPSVWSIGRIRSRVAELGCVATLPEYRRQGLQGRLMTEYHKSVSEQEYDVSAIEGIPYFYRQFGYEYAIPLDEQTRIALNKIPDYESAHTIRPFTYKDIPRAMQLLGQAQEKFYVHALRDEGIWKMQQETGVMAEYKFEAYSVEDGGEMIAYFRINSDPEGKELFLREVTDVGSSVTRSILKFLKETGRRRELDRLICTISHHEPFAKHLVATGDAEQPMPYAWQIRIINHARLFRKMIPLFEKRLEASTYNCLTEKVNFNFYRFTVQLAIRDGIITDVQRVESSQDRTIRFNPAVFTQLLLSYRSREELERVYPDFIVRPSHKGLIDVLFPKLPSYIHTGY